MDHTSRHFEFGNDDLTDRSLYTKDYGTDSRIETLFREVSLPPIDSAVFPSSCDELGDSTTRSQHSEGTFALACLMNDSRSADARRNQECRLGDSISLSTEEGEDSHDRRSSLMSSSYLSPPLDFIPMPPRREPRTPYRYLDTFPSPRHHQSEAKNNFWPAFLSPDEAGHRARFCGNAERVKWGQASHFVFGYQPNHMLSEHKEQYERLDSRLAQRLKAAGKPTENPSPRPFNHIGHSENTEDMMTDPHRANTHAMATMVVPPRRQYLGNALLQPLPVHKASVMTNDYQPFMYRRFSPAQLRNMEKYDQMLDQPIEKSHYFHFDKSYVNNLHSTTQVNFIQPQMRAVAAL